MDVEVEAQADESGGFPGISGRTVEEIARLDGVAAAAGRVDGLASVADRNGGIVGAGMLDEGANFAPGKGGEDELYTFTDGSGPTGAGQVALDRDIADKGGYAVGDTVPVALTGPAKPYKLSGVFTTEATTVAEGGSLVLFDTPVAQRLFLRPGVYRSVTVTAAPGTSSTELAAAVGTLLPDHTQARTGRQLAQEKADTAAGTTSAPTSTGASTRP
ncbi:ABC transporter permease [Streptomyces niveiscabiei]|uniref:ABC transporter permease n=1 Tax=Streptomyces niveiscabiei TaxID=164115 RepID=UPI0006EB42FA